MSIGPTPYQQKVLVQKTHASPMFTPPVSQTHRHITHSAPPAIGHHVDPECSIYSPSPLSKSYFPHAEIFTPKRMTAVRASIIANAQPVDFQPLVNLNPAVFQFPEGSKLAKLEKLAQNNMPAELQLQNVTNGYVEKTPKEAIETDLVNALMAIKQIAISQGKPLDEKIKSPIEDLKDPSWIKDSTVYNISPRAVGGLVNSIKMLPSIRQDAVYLTPIFENCDEQLYAQSNFDLDPELWKKDLDILNKGVSHDFKMKPDELMQAFVEAAHLLDKKVGMDLIPHVGSWAEVILEKPELFRWERLKDDRSGLKVGLGVDLTNKNDPYLSCNGGRTVQEDIKESAIKTLREMKQNDLADKLCHPDYTVADILQDIRETRPAIKQDFKNSVMAKLKMEKGYVNVPVAPWNGSELPQFKEWNKQYNYPQFISGDKDPYGSLTPFKFYHNKQSLGNSVDVNRRNDEAVKYFAEIFPKTRERFDFDFIRADMAKHAVDSNNKGDTTSGSAKRLGFATEDVWKEVINRARDESKPGGHKAVAAIAECFGKGENEEAFANMGFNLTLGNEQYWVPGPNNDNNITDRLRDASGSVQEIADKKNKGWVQQALSRMFCFDTHDCAVGSNKHRVDKSNIPMQKIFMALGLFATGAGESKRPFYMIMGNEDASRYQDQQGRDLTVKNGLMPLANNKELNKAFHKMMNAYQSVERVLTDKSAKITLNDREPILEAKVVSNAGDVLTLINTNPNGNSEKMIEIPSNFKSNEKRMILMEDVNSDVKNNEFKKFSRMLGDKTYVNLPPGESHVFKMTVPKTDSQWIQNLCHELTKYQPNITESRDIIKNKLHDADFRDLPGFEHNKDVAVSIATNDKDEKFLIINNLRSNDITIDPSQGGLKQEGLNEQVKLKGRQLVIKKLD